MYLKELTLKGFKTFADKTTLTFDPAPSITAIVGPNGCGKSNVIDALRFAIGEQSMREIRGDSLEEMIFAGSSAKKALSLGEVAMVMDNSDGRLKADYSEVQIRRRVFRSGESEFYINKNLCRLRDIKELFLDTGVGDGAYSIVNQGQVDAILSSKPEERRALFEEAAKISTYKFKKRAAERRLIATEQNLLRVNDLKNEIAENIASLEIQAQKALEFQNIKEKLKTLEISLSKRQLQYLSDKKTVLVQKIEELKGQTIGAEGVAAKEEEERQKVKNDIKEIESAVDVARNEMNAKRIQFEETKSRINVGNERLLQLGERLVNLDQEKERALVNLTSRISAASLLDSFGDGFNTESLLAGTYDLEGLLVSRKEGLCAVSSEAESASRELASVTSRIEELKKSSGVSKERLSQLSERAESLRDEISRLEGQLQSSGQKLEEYRNILAEYKEQHRQSQEHMSGAGQIFDSINRKIEESLKMWNSLKNPVLERELELTDKKHAISEIDLSIRFAKENLDKDVQFFDNLNGLKEDMKVLESELIGMEGVSSELKQRILGRKGQIIEKIDVELSALGRIIEEQKAKLSVLESRKSEEEGLLNGIQSSFSEASSQYSILEKRMSELTAEKEAAIAKLAETKAVFGTFEQGLKERTSAVERASSDMTSLTSEKERKEKELSGIDSRKAEASRLIEEIEKELPGAEMRQAELTVRNNELSSRKASVERLISVLEQISLVVHELKAKMAESENISARIASTKEEIAGLESSLPEISLKEKELGSSVEDLIAKKASLETKAEALEEKIRQLTSEDRGIRDALSKEEVNLAKIEGELSSIEALMMQEYQLSVQDILASAVEEASNMAKSKDEVESLKNAIRELGPVNLLAVEEFEAAKERMSFIETQYNDLISARDNLNTLIRQLDGEAKEKFMSTIEEVNVYFSEIFGTLFEGGEARIELAEGDPLEAGIEIVAKPLGKKWINLSLMSGGEKALTAISILFALMRKNPSPFCFMDEVDAALDEINTIRFAKLLKDFSERTQIIVITHSKRTMSVANNLYGITMEEPGISKLVSMKLVKVAD